jgi:hypothetical protein
LKEKVLGIAEGAVGGVCNSIELMSGSIVVHLYDENLEDSQPLDVLV